MMSNITLKKILYIFEGIYFFLFAIYQMIGAAHTVFCKHILITVTIVSAGILLADVYMNLKAVRKDASLIIMFIVLTMMIGVFLGTAS